MSKESEALAKKRLSEVEFRRWRILMNKIDSLESEREVLSKQMNSLTKRSNELYKEMRQLWEFTK